MIHLLIFPPMLAGIPYTPMCRVALSGALSRLGGFFVSICQSLHLMLQSQQLSYSLFAWTSNGVVVLYPPTHKATEG